MKLYLYITDVETYSTGEVFFRAYAEGSHETSWIPDSWIFVGEIDDIDIDVDNKKVTQRAIDILEEAEQKEIAEHEVKMGILKEKKANLLSITHQCQMN